MLPNFIHNSCDIAVLDVNVTGNPDEPDFTIYFEKTVLVWIPCAFLWIVLPIEIYFLRRTKTYNIPFNVYNFTKLVAITSLKVITLINLVHNIFLDDSPNMVDVYSHLIQLVTFALCFGLTYANIKCGIRSSSILFLFFLLLAVCGAPRYRTEFRSREDSPKNHEPMQFMSYMFYYPIVLSLFVLNCFADVPPAVSVYPVNKNACPEHQSSFLCQILFAWFDKMVWKGYWKPLDYDDLWISEYSETTACIVPKFEKIWSAAMVRTKKVPDVSARLKAENQELLGVGSKDRTEITYRSSQCVSTVSIVRPLCEAFGVVFLCGSILKLFHVLLLFVNPQILRLLIKFVGSAANSTTREPMWCGYLYVCLLSVFTVLQTLLMSQYFHRIYKNGLRVRTALISAIYKKALHISSRSRRDFTSGEIVNLMAIDAQRFVDLIVSVNVLWAAPLQIGLALYFLWDVLGPCVLAGLAFMIMLVPANGFIISKIKKLQIKQMKYKDNRIRLMNEVLSGIKVLKLHAWESSFEKQIISIRNNEIDVLKMQAYLSAATSFVWTCAPFMVCLLTFAVFVLSSDENILDAETAFVSLSLFNLLKVPLSALPTTITTLVQANVSIKRINKFLNSEELDLNAVSHESRTEAVTVENGTFSWECDEGSPTLHNINVRIMPGSLVAVVGPVGSGKSSLLAACLGEMYKQSGLVNIMGTVAYVPQQAWIRNATLKDNIILGETDNSFYKKVLDACALNEDIEVLPSGDSTEIGEKGINLSGGQKLRVSLARAVYFGADTYFLDDPLSAVDSHVGKHIFDHVIGPNGLLRGKTRILVTHSITYLSHVNLIIVIKEGTVSEFGSFNELLEKKGDFADFLLTYSKENTNLLDAEDEILRDGYKFDQITRHRLRSNESSSTKSYPRTRCVSKSSDVQEKRSRMGNVTGQELIEKEKAETGNIKWKVYSYYLSSVGAMVIAVTVILISGYQGFSVASNVWLSAWSNDASVAVNGTQDISKRNMFLSVYAGFGLSQAVSVLLGSFSLTRGMIAAAKYLHQFMLSHTLRAPLRYFDTTPVGRIVNCFGKDVDVLDNVLPQIIRQWLLAFFGVLSTLFVIGCSTPIFITVMLPMGALYYFVQRFYVATSRQLGRLESIARSPIYSHFGESVAGAMSIRAYGLREKFIHESNRKIDFHLQSYYPNLVANRWLSVRLEMVGNSIIFFAALFAVLGRDTLTAGIVGLSVSYALQITHSMQLLVRMTSDVETNMVAIERIKEYRKTPCEAAWEIENEQVPSDWPHKGDISFNDFQVRYREGLELVLKGISFHVAGGQKVGIVGRTGAGKSSLTLSLFRILESAGGEILIDGHNVSTLGLHTLRSRLTIIPQDPVLFSGTLRFNLDPVGKYSNESVWRALELAHLKTYITSLKFGLQCEVAEGGDNFSVGQRQLICLARALLQKTKLLILDEATAAVDLETDDVIQTTIRNEFADCTILTIAHRLNTIMDYDRIIVLDNGHVVEYDSPSVLLKSESSNFYRMAADAGLVREANTMSFKDR